MHDDFGMQSMKNRREQHAVRDVWASALGFRSSPSASPKKRHEKRDTRSRVSFSVITQHYRFFEIAFKKSVYDSKNNLMRRAHLSFDSSVVSETAPSSRSVTT